MAFTTTDPITQFRESIADSGLTPPDHIIADGNLHRFSSNGKPTDLAGWYVFHTGRIPAGSYGCWRSGLIQSFRADLGRSLTDDERQYLYDQKKKEAAARALALSNAREAAKVRASRIWGESVPANGQAYLIAKGVSACGARQTKTGDLVIPMSADGEIQSIQTISPNGDKKFLGGGRVSGCSFLIGKVEDKAILIAEGFATGATLHEATGLPVFVAFNAGNLLAVAKQVRADHPNAVICVASDDDFQTPNNPGYTKALEAAFSINGALARPWFGSRREDGQTDFNDMAKARGLAEVRREIEWSLPEGSL